MKCGPDGCPIVTYDLLTPAEKIAQRKTKARELSARGFTEAQIAKQLRVSQATISKDLVNLLPGNKLKPAKTPGNPKGAGRPKGSKKPKAKKSNGSVGATSMPGDISPSFDPQPAPAEPAPQSAPAVAKPEPKYADAEREDLIAFARISWRVIAALGSIYSEHKVPLSQSVLQLIMQFKECGERVSPILNEKAEEEEEVSASAAPAPVADPPSAPVAEAPAAPVAEAPAEPAMEVSSVPPAQDVSDDGLDIPESLRRMPEPKLAEHSNGGGLRQIGAAVGRIMKGI